MIIFEQSSYRLLHHDLLYVEEEDVKRHWTGKTVFDHSSIAKKGMLARLSIAEMRAVILSTGKKHASVVLCGAGSGYSQPASVWDAKNK